MLLHLHDALHASTTEPALAEPPPPPDDATAFISLPAQALAAACYVPFLAGSPVEVRAASGLITLCAGQFSASVPGLDSHGAGALTLDAAAFAGLWRQLNPAVKNGLADATLTVFVAPPTLCICAPDGFAIEATV